MQRGVWRAGLRSQPLIDDRRVESNPGLGPAAKLDDTKLVLVRVYPPRAHTQPGGHLRHGQEIAFSVCPSGAAFVRQLDDPPRNDIDEFWVEAKQSLPITSITSHMVLSVHGPSATGFGARLSSTRTLGGWHRSDSPVVLTPWVVSTRNCQQRGRPQQPHKDVLVASSSPNHANGSRGDRPGCRRPANASTQNERRSAVTVLKRVAGRFHDKRTDEGIAGITAAMSSSAPA
jgi:hypothetical protein